MKSRPESRMGRREGCSLRAFGGTGVRLVVILCVLLPPAVAFCAPLQSACEIDYPPFSMVDDNGHPDGFSVELLRAAARAMGREVDFRTGTWAEVKALLARGEIQALPLVGRTPEREAIYDFTFPYLSLHGAIVVRDDDEGIRELSDLRGRSVAVMRGDNAEEFLRRIDLDADVRPTPTFEQALRELSEGRHDAVVIQRLLALRLIRRAGLENLRIVERPLTEFRQDFCFAVQEGDAETLALLNEGLALAMADGTFRNLHAKWFAALELSFRDRIVVGGGRDCPPYEFLDAENRPAGYLVDLTRALFREIGMEVEIRLARRAEIAEALASGDIDAVQSMVYTPERDLALNFTPPHTAIPQVAVIRRGEGPPPETVADLRGRKGVVVRGGFMQEFAFENGLADGLGTVESLAEALEAVVSGEFDCALVPRLPALYFIRDRGWNRLIVGRRPFLLAETGYAVRQNRAALLSRLSEGLKALEESGEFHRIREKWLGVYPEMGPATSTLLKYAAWTGFPLLLAILFLFLRLQAGRKAERRTARAALRTSEARFKAIYDAMPLYLAIWQRQENDFVLADVNPATERLSRKKIRELLGTPLREFYADMPWIVAAIERAHREGMVVRWESDYRMRSTGRVRHLNFRFVPVPPDAVMAVAEDVTERKEAEAALAESEEKYRRLTEMAPIGTAVLVEKRIVFANKETARIFGEASPEAMLGRTPAELVAPEDRASAAENMSILFERREAVPWVERRAPQPDGGFLDVEISAVPIFYEGKPAVQACLRDISERKRLEAERTELERRIESARRHESLATMAGAIAHNFNNILMTVLGNLDMALEDAPESDPVRELVLEAHRAAHRAAGLSRLMRLYVGREVGVHQVFCLRELIRAYWSRLLPRVPESIRLVWRPNPEGREFPVRGDEARVFEALLHLVENAAEAVGDGPGEIAIQVDRQTLSREDIAVDYGIDPPEPGKFVCLSVTDDGAGMEEETRRRLFEPYFTTKFTGRGLGLAAVLGIVRSHGGVVRVSSRPGAGAAVALCFPAAGAELGSAPLPSEEIAASSG
jgi:PAS domain S-box-containing protein